MTVQDPSEKVKSGYHNTNAVSVWFRDNRVLVSPLEYVKGITAIQPDVFVSLCDGDTEMGASNKRISKAVSKTVDFLDTCIGQRDLTDSLMKTGVIGAVEGGLNSKARTKSASETVAPSPGLTSTTWSVSTRTKSKCLKSANGSQPCREMIYICIYVFL